MHPRLLAATERARTAECDASSFGRRTHRSGKDTVEHPRNGHDDYANVVCGVLSLLAPPAFEQPNELASPIIVSGGAITPVWGGRSRIEAARTTWSAGSRNPTSTTPLLARRLTRPRRPPARSGERFVRAEG